MNEAEYHLLVQKGLRGKLSVGERMALEAYLATRPELRAAWEEEQGLNQLLEQLPAVPVATNFTSRVLQAVSAEVRGEEAASGRPAWRQLISLAWLRPAAVACLLVGVVSLSVHQHRSYERAQLANTLKQLTQVPSVEMLKDFEAINRLGQASHFVDESLLTVSE